jgi:hypothetical protein
LLCPGTIGPDAADPAPVPGEAPVDVVAGGGEDAVAPVDDEVLAEQAPTPSSAAVVRMAAAQLVRPDLFAAP